MGLISLSDHYSRIFLLSHMRAFTSLAGHILGSHSQINGYYEMHISYADAQALDKQLDLYRRHDELKADSRYLFDKLLHNEYQLQPDQLGITGIKILLALREPEQSIKSIVNLFAQKETAEPYATPLEATNYYIERVTALAAFCRAAGQDYFYFDAEVLQSAPGTLLPALSSWLDLEPALSERYVTLSQTGKERKGDSSENIQSGKISETKSTYPAILVPEELLNKAQLAYRDCRLQIIGNAAESVIL